MQKFQDMCRIIGCELENIILKKQSYMLKFHIKKDLLRWAITLKEDNFFLFIKNQIQSISTSIYNMVLKLWYQLY